MAPFLADQDVSIPNKDIHSWYFDEPQYDQDRPIYVDANDPSQYWTADECRETIRQLVAGFHAAGLQPGETVCLLGFNSIDYPVIANGIVAAGGVFTGANPAHTVHELVHHLETSRAKMAIVDRNLMDTFAKAAAEASIPRDRIYALDRKASPGHKSWTELTKCGNGEWNRIRDRETAESTIAALLFSSGTTGQSVKGLPKAVTLSHYNFVAQCTVLGDMKGAGWHKRRLVALPMFHASTVPTCHFNPLFTGDVVYILPRFELESYLRYTEKYAITDLAIVPPLIHRILSSDLRHKYSLKSIRNAHCGAAPLDTETQARFCQLLSPSTPLTQVWGMTETVATCCMTPYRLGHERTGSAGRMAPNTDVKLCDDDGNDITADDMRGELCIRGPFVTKGYFHNPEANARDWDEDGFFHTGDIACRSKESKLWYIVDRKKELIKIRGFQVAPSELEGVLVSHPNVHDAAVVGVELDGDEHPRAYVVGTDVTADEIRAFLGQRLAKYKQCTGGIVFVAEIPRTASGKLLGRNLGGLEPVSVKPKL